MQNKYTFEQAVARLEEIGTLLSSGTVTLEASIELYKEASELIRISEQKLRDAKLEIEKINAAMIGA